MPLFSFFFNKCSPLLIFMCLCKGATFSTFSPFLTLSLLRYVKRATRDVRPIRAAPKICTAPPSFPSTKQKKAVPCSHYPPRVS